MGIRDDEIQRLVHYAKGMGVKVTFSNTLSSDMAAAWATDGSEILINNKTNLCKTEIILSLIHEIAHHLYFIHEKNRKPDLKFDEAIDAQNLCEYEVSDKPVAKRLRKRIYEVEHASSLYWDVIYKETNLRFPMWKLHATREFDVWQYEVYYLTGHFPKTKQRSQKIKEINLHYKNKKDTIK